MQLSPIKQLDAIRQRQQATCRFTAQTVRAASAWQAKARRKLARCLMPDSLQTTDLHPRILEKVDRGEYWQQKVLIHATPFSDVPLYLLVPKEGQSPFPCVLALHGHGYGANAIVGITEEGQFRVTPHGYQQDFAVELVKRGFVVAVPEISCFGLREENYGHLPEQSPRPSTCHNASTYALMLGLNMIGMRVWDGIRVVDYLQTLDFVDSGRLGAMGISGGGMHAFFSACVDPRIKATVISGYFCDWRQSILAINHCTCNFVPGLLQLGELSDLAGLRAPRPLLVENGTHDPIFPIEDVKDTVARARKAWKLMGAEDRLETDYFEDGHRINGIKAYPFLVKHLALAC